MSQTVIIIYIFFSANRKARKWEDIKYKISFIDSAGFMVCSLSSLTDNLKEGLHKCKYNDCKSSFEYMTIKDSLLTFKCVYCNKTYEKKFHEDLSKRFENAYLFFNGVINRFFSCYAESCLSIIVCGWLGVVVSRDI